MQKLLPFFPPQDQSQSISLRAALLRCLEQAKKTGVLGRDAVLRKTMLDECKGERLEDVLAAFSSAVLKKVVAETAAAAAAAAGGQTLPPAARLAIESRDFRDDRTELQVLALAHRASISSMLQAKKKARAQYRDFAELLGVKERAVLRRQEDVRQKEQLGRGSVSQDAKAEMKRMVQTNWGGQEQWMEALIHGHAAGRTQGPFGMPLDRVWRRVQQDRLSELEEDSAPILEQLEKRVQMHRTRLEKWKNLRDSLATGASQASPSKKAAAPKRVVSKGIDFGFGAHESLQLGALQANKLQTRPKGCDDTCEKIVQSLRDELARLDNDRPEALAFLRQRSSAQDETRIRKSAVAEHEQEKAEEEEVISELSDLGEPSEEDVERDMEVEHEQAPPSRAPIQSFQNKLRAAGRPILKAKTATSTSGPPSESSSEDGEVTPRRHVPDSATTPRARRSPPRFAPHSPETVPSPTQQIADQILESMDAASPSPTKQRSKPRHTLSLADRTRMSMMRSANPFLDEEPELDLPPIAASQASRSVTTSMPPLQDDAKSGDEDDLLSRTRKSMAGFEQAQKKAQLQRRRSERRSKMAAVERREVSHGYFPRVPEEGGGEEIADRTLRLEEQMLEEDVEAVFRSRPKIIASPLPSPTRDWD